LWHLCDVKIHPIFLIFGIWNPEEIQKQNIINLPTSPVYCGRTTLKSAKSHFSINNVIYMCFWMFSLLLNKMDYNCHNAAVREVTSYRKCSKWPPSARTQLRSLMRHCSITSRTMHSHFAFVYCALLEFSPCLNHAAAATRPQSTFRGTRACIIPKMR